MLVTFLVFYDLFQGRKLDRPLRFLISWLVLNIPLTVFAYYFGIETRYVFTLLIFVTLYVEARHYRIQKPARNYSLLYWALTSLGLGFLLWV